MEYLKILNYLGFAISTKIKKKEPRIFSLQWLQHLPERMVTYPLHDVAAFTITRDKPLSCANYCANLLAKQVVYPRLYPPQIFPPPSLSAWRYFPWYSTLFFQRITPLYRPSSIHSHSYITKCVRAFKLCYFRRAETI